MSDLENIGNLEFVGNPVPEPEDKEEEQPTIEELREVAEYRRREEVEWRKRERDRLLEQVPKPPE